MDNILLVYELPSYNNKNHILSYDYKPLFTSSINKPSLKYGFHYYIHQTKKKMEIFDHDKRDYHKIVNSFEDTIPDDYNRYNRNDSTSNSNEIKLTDDIKKFSLKFFNTDKIISRAFYKFWEMLMIFPLLRNETKSINTLHLAEAPGSFIQALIYYREKIYNNIEYKQDKYIAVSIDEVTNKKNEYIPIFSSSLEQNKQFERWKYKDSDITKLDIIKKFLSDNKKLKADLITADGGFNWIDENFQEQEAYKLLLTEIYCALKVQSIGGNFVIKFFETFTDVSVKIIEILRHNYKLIYIYKPLLSRPSNSERYIICLNYLANMKDIDIDKIYNVLEQIDNSNEFLFDIFSDYEIPKDIQLLNTQICTKLSNIQFKQMNDMISYYYIGNYYGDEYNNYLLKRKDANDFWISTFYPIIKKNDIPSIKKLLKKLIDKTLNKNIEDYKILFDQII